MCSEVTKCSQDLNYFYIRIFFPDISLKNFIENLCKEVEDLHGADEGEARDKPHVATYSGQLNFQIFLIQF